MIWQNIKNAFISIKSAKLRSFLTVIGVVIGVFAVLVMIGVGDGVKKDVGGEISSLGTNVLTVASGRIGQSNVQTQNNQQQRSGQFGFSGGFGTSTLTQEDVNSLKNISDIDKITTFGIISSSVQNGVYSSPGAFVISAEPSYFGIRNIKLSEGREITDADNKDKKYVAVIGSNTKADLFGEGDAIGKKISLRGKEFEVIGITKKSDGGLSFGASSDDVVIVPYDTGSELTGKNEIFRILVQVNDANNVEEVKKAMIDKIKSNHAGEEDFSVLTQDELLGTFNSILDILTAFVVAIAAISLLVGGIGIMNIMLVTVSERTKEIGIRKAMGATFGNILGQFLTESIVISLIGGVIGVGLSYLAGFVIERLTDITPVFSARALIAAIGVSLLVGIIFGTAPAIKAARKNPIQALKSL
jgi:putative ABC transport system permease protein